jgi:diguanylate cyclase (GGDEF)-like protein
MLTFEQIVSSNPLAPNLSLDLAEAARLQVLESYDILDSAAEKPYDDIARLAAFICATPIALITFLGPGRHWLKARYSSHVFSKKLFDFPGYFSKKPSAGPTVVPDMTRDPRFAAHPLVTGPARLRLYAAKPLIAPAGELLGSLCVLDRRSRPLGPEQVHALETLAHQVMELLEMRRTVIGLSLANARLGQQNLTDALTAIPNRRAYDQKLAEEHARAKRTGTPLSLLLIDIDSFKQYNDSFGHPAGDAALHSVAHVLQASLRPYDFLARYGGEEFALILPATTLEDALIVAERVRALVADTELPHRKLTISIGVARLNAETDLQTLVQTADNDLYRAKAGGRNKVATAEPGKRDSKDGKARIFFL